MTIQSIISSILDFLIYFSASLITVIRNNIIPLVSRGAGDKRNDGFGIAHVQDFMRHAWFNVNEIAGFVLQHLLEAGPELMAYFSFQDIQDQLESDVNVGAGNATGRRVLFDCPSPAAEAPPTAARLPS